MKNLIAILFLLLLVFMFAKMPEDKTIAVVRMDGVGWYRVDNYKLYDKCVHFKDGAGEEIKFCGSFDLTPKHEFYKFENIKHDL